MSRTSIPVDEETKARLDGLKRDDETWDEFLQRITSGREPMNFGAWGDEAADEAMKHLRDGRERPDR
ncbi:DUF7557 family protein [Halosimplex pelagicum]|uniref:Uncharacterized protein n=1 Tax=Halosimplex pelagicum TaxID=869886 RepID=A0A7D5STM6_9EURY|nr:hypothetical protein [Halosimplex pelagicum]QLH80547.1 hypothetical protein HZS54_02380 [Halosimplex pelagicum]